MEDFSRGNFQNTFFPKFQNHPKNRKTPFWANTHKMETFEKVAIFMFLRTQNDTFLHPPPSSKTRLTCFFHFRACLSVLFYSFFQAYATCNSPNILHAKVHLNRLLKIKTVCFILKTYIFMTIFITSLICQTPKTAQKRQKRHFTFFHKKRADFHVFHISPYSPG